jgi:hypothetical protein
MLNKPQDQSAGEGTVAIQAGGSADNVTVTQTNNYGLTAEEVRSVAKDAFRADFVQLLGQAGDIAETRANRVVERYLERLQTENPAGLNQANTPDFRYALFAAQKAQARSGDENLEALLVELLIERSREQQRNLQQIVLTEALEVVSRLTDEQVATLSLSFVVRRVSRSHMLHFEDFLKTMDEYVVPFVGNAKLSDASFSHMDFTGCGTVEMREVTLATQFLYSYPGIWQAGFSEDDPIFQQLTVQARNLVRPSQHRLGQFEVAGGTRGLAEIFQESTIPDIQQRALLNQLLNRSLTPDQIKDRCVAARPYMADLFGLWDNTLMKQFNPSSVGVAIAHANITRSISNLPALSAWIN